MGSKAISRASSGRPPDDLRQRRFTGVAGTSRGSTSKKAPGNGKFRGVGVEANADLKNLTRLTTKRLTGLSSWEDTDSLPLSGYFNSLQ